MVDSIATGIEIPSGPGRQRWYTCAAATAIAKGAVLMLTDPRTAARTTDTSTDNGYAFAGIAAMDKDGSAGGDASTKITAWVKGIFKMKSSGAITAGSLVLNAGSGYVFAVPAATEIASGSIVGKALETSADEDTLQIAVGELI